MDGIEAMKRDQGDFRILSTGGESKIIALYRKCHKRNKKTVLDSGFDEYLEKPMEFDRMEDVLKKIYSCRKNIIWKSKKG